MLTSLSAFAQGRDVDPARGADDRDEKPSVSISGYIGNLSTLSAASSAQTTVQSASKDALVKEFRFRPEIDVNKNTGNLRAGFNINLPANLSPLTKLNFTYNSKNTRNIGYGTGWSLNLPNITLDKTTNELKHNGQKLVEVEKLFINKRLEKVLSFYNINSKKIKYYRKEIESNFSLILEINAQDTYFLELNLDGQDRLYNADGQLISIKDSFNNEAKLSWSNGALQNIKTSSFTTKLNYKNESSEYTYLGNNFYNLPEKLISIDFKVDSEIRQVLFNYKENLLTQVKWKDGVKTIFKGEYQAQKKNGVKLSGKKISKDNVFISDVEGGTYSLPTKKGENNFLYIDLNGDNYQDRITINGGYISNTLNYFVKKLKGNWTYSEYIKNLKHFLGKRPNITFTKVEMAIIKDGVKEYIEDKTLNPSLALGLHPYSISLKRDEGNVNVRSSIKNGTYFVDINSDGKKDFVYCGGSVNKDKDLVSHYDALMRLTGKLSGSLTSSFWQLSGKIAQVYIQDYDLDKVQEAYHHGGISKPENFVPNASKWTKVNHLTFNCSEKSIWHDFNQDGHLDVLTGNTIYFLSPNKVYKRNISKTELLAFVSVANDLPIKNKFEGWSLTSDSNTNKILLTKLKQTVINPKTLDQVELTGSGEYSIEKKSKVPLLTKVKSDFGGSYSVIYKNLNNNWVVTSKKIDADDLKQPIETISYSYLASLVDPFKGVINGYSKVKSSFDYGTKLKSNNAIVEEFSIDTPNVVMFLESRARLNGKLKKVSFLDQNDFTYKTIQNKWEITNLGKTIFPTIINKKTKYFLTSMPSGYYKITETDTDYSEFEANIPTKVKTHNRDSSALTSGLYQRGGMFSKKVETLRKLDLDHYRLMTLEETTANDKSSFSKKYLYGPGFKPIEISHKDEFVALEYDALGRVVKVSDHYGDFKSFIYESGTKLPINVIESEVEKSFVYDQFLSKPSVAKVSGATVKNHYSTDGVLLESLRKKCSSCDEILVYAKTIDFKNRAVDITQFGRKHTYYFDGLGRVVQEYLPFSKPIYSSYSIFDSNDVLLQETYPNSDELLTSNVFNGQNKLIKTTSFSNEITKSYAGYCEETKLNNVFQRDICKSSNGDVTSIEENGARFLYEYDVLDNLKVVKGAGQSLIYKRDSSFRLKESTFKSQRKELLSFLVDYDKKKRITTIENSKRFKFSPNGKLNEIETARGTNVKMSYSLGRLESKQIIKGLNSIKSNFKYDNIGSLTQFTTDGIKVDHFYNDYDQLSQTKVNGQVIDYDYDYTRVSSIKPFITNIIYDDFGRLTQVEYANSPALNISYNEEKLNSLSLGQDEFNYSYDLENKINGITKNSSITTIDYNKGQLNSTPKVKWNNFDDFGRVKKLGNHKLDWDLTELVKVDDVQLIYEDQSLAMACDTDCFKIHSENFLTYKDNVIQRIVIAQKTVGIVVNGKFYAVLSDHLGSIVAVYDGNKKIITRNYDLWGNKQVKVESGYEELEKLIAWSYAGLIEPPQLSGKGLYWSKSRVYSSELKHWLSVDPAVMYSPEKLISSTQDWNGVLYCNGDPVNNVDPSGHYVKQIGKYTGAVLQESMTTFGPGDVVGSVIGGAIGTGVGATVGFAYGGPIGAEVGGTLGSLVGGAIGGAIGGLFDNPGIDPNEDAKVFERNSKAKADAMLKDMGIKKEDIELDFNSRTLELNMDFQDNSGPQLKQDNSFNTQVY
jgi:RHS repeat-associated protein